MKRAEININGIVQGVGFRPFIHKLVKEYDFKGWVKNTVNGVAISLEGEEEELNKFIQRIKYESPKLAFIEEINFIFYDDLKNYTDFKIAASAEENEKFTLVSPDVCICEDCLKELFNIHNRRYLFPFINCTNCGPRFTIIKDIPYDRNKTTMDEFKMCHECDSEYKNIEDRRYHAQPNCCYTCGPKLSFTDENGEKINGDPIAIAASYIKSGKIVAIKGLGGFHIACDALNENAVYKLRERKQREEKPFAVMFGDIDTVKKYCIVSQSEENILKSFKRPIVLLKKKGDMLNYISSDNNYIGVMLPYTPVHYLLFNKCIGPLIMTSANSVDLPMVYKNEDALTELKGIADGFLMNNRDIHVRCDDSLLMVFEDKEYFIRRSRGYVPYPIKINIDAGEVLSCGGEQKASFTLSKGKYLFLSQHIGDMKNIETYDNYESQINHFQNLFNIEVKKIACDLHPDYMSTEYAIKRGKKDGIKVAYIQHHHAHMAACMADNNLYNDVIGIIFDGTGFGMDGTIWGGEFLTGGYRGFKRYGTIRSIPLPGGDAAIKGIYRIEYALLKETFGEIPDEFKSTEDALIIDAMIEKKLNTPCASSIGRLFDGVSSLIGLKKKAAYEGQGAIILESIAEECEDLYEYSIDNYNNMRIFNWESMIKGITADLKNNVPKGIIASKFMNTIIDMAVSMSFKIRRETGLNEIVLSGGVFQNIYLLSGLKKKLIEAGFKVYNHQRISANDEGISIGQALITAYGGYVKCV